MFIVKSISIRREFSYMIEPSAMGNLKGKIELTSGRNADINFDLTDEQTEAMLKLVGESIIAHAKQAAKELSMEAITMLPPANKPELLG